MDSLKLDRFRKLLNRQNTTINACDAPSLATANTPTASWPVRSASTVCESTIRTTTTTTTTTTTSTAIKDDIVCATSGISSTLAIASNLPPYVTKDDPIPAVFIARKLFSDYIELVSNKIEVILNLEQGSRDKPIFKTLRREQDPIYDQILEGLGAISEYCLPSLLTLLINWYHYQLDIEDGFMHSVNKSTDIQQRPSTLENSFQHNNEVNTSLNLDRDLSLPDCCGSPSCQAEDQLSLGHQPNSLLCQQSLRSLGSPSPEMSINQPSGQSNQISIASSLPLDYQSPSSLTTISIPNANQDDNQQQQCNTSAANTSSSTATTNASSNSITLDDSTNATKRLQLIKTRCILIEYAFCQALMEIFRELYLHPGHDELIAQIEGIAFGHFKHSDHIHHDRHLHGVELSDINQLASNYAEVIGILAKTRFSLIKRRFMTELNELRSQDPTPYNIQCIVTLLSGMRFFRVKMAPIEEFETSFQLLQELADYFVEVRHKSIRHALAELFFEIMLPLATIVKNEVKIPCLKNFVDTLWSPTLDMCTRKKHSSTLFPLVTCLLCVSQRQVFLQNWSPFLNMCQSNLKNRDQNMSRIALESLYRLIWMYMIRIKCESNNVTQTRLNSIVESLFPKGSRQIVPRDAKLSIFVDIIQFIAQERLDFAMRHIIFELLSVDRSFKVVVAPERMNIGLQAFLAIADNLQQKESELSMPIVCGTASSSQHQASPACGHHNYCDNNNNTHNTAHTYNIQNTTLRRSPYGCNHNRMLTDETAKSIGLHAYYSHIQKSFNEILKALDSQFGRPLMLTCYSNYSHKDVDDLISAERRPKMELFKTCIAAIPRLMPDGMSKSELINLLSRMTVHVDEEMRRHAFESLQILVTEFQDWRLDAIEGYTLFLANQVDESFKHLVDSTLKMLLQLLISWRNLITSSPSYGGGGSSSSYSASAIGYSSSAKTNIVSIQTGYETISNRQQSGGGAGGQIAARKNRALAEMRLIQSELSNTRFDKLVNVLQKVEGASLVMLCSCHHQTRRLASHLLRESRSILRCYSSWTCMEQFGFKSPEEVEYGGQDGDDLSASLRGSLSADNLSRITSNSCANGPAHSSVTSMNTQAMLSTSVSRMCISSSQQQISGGGGADGGGNNNNSVSNNNNNSQQHDLYDEDIENNLGDCYSSDNYSTTIFWIAVMMLESSNEQEYSFALRLLRKILPNMPFEQQDFVDELNRSLSSMYDNCSHQETNNTFPGLHKLVLRGCASAGTYELCIGLLDHMTPILKQKICTSNDRLEDSLPFHILMLATHLLATYEDPKSFSLNVARRLALCCEENSQKLENLAAVMTLYSRRSFSKDAFQWIKCIVKYLNDACPEMVPKTVPFLLELLENGLPHVQRLILPIVYCILTYIDINQQLSSSFNAHLLKIYTKCLGPSKGVVSASSANTKSSNTNQSASLWRDAMLVFKLIISRSSTLNTRTSVSTATTTAASTPTATSSGFASLTSPPSIHSSSTGFASLSSTFTAPISSRGGLQLPGRTLDFSLEIESLPMIGKSRLIELGANLAICNQQQQQPQQQQLPAVQQSAD